jgi:hypothetical protein
VPNFARHRMRPVCLAICVWCWLAGTVPLCAASMSGRDIEIIAKALGFLDPAPHGGMVAVLYGPGDAGSKKDADAIVALFGDGIESAGGTVQARAIEVGAFGAGAGYVAIIIAAGAEDRSGIVSPGAHRLLSITAVDSLVRSGQCVMAVHSQPRVDITVNRAAAQAAGVGFTAAFGMLVHEI